MMLKDMLLQSTQHNAMVDNALMSDGCIDRCTQLGVVNNAVAGIDSRLLPGFLVSSSSIAGSVLVWGFHRKLELWEVFRLTVRHLSNSGIAQQPLSQQMLLTQEGICCGQYRLRGTPHLDDLDIQLHHYNMNKFGEVSFRACTPRAVSHLRLQPHPSASQPQQYVSVPATCKCFFQRMRG
jgi:hypothetical protein